MAPLAWRRRLPAGTDGWLLLAALVVPLAFCAARFGLDLWYDEAFTVQTFVSMGFETIVTDYSFPNNHVFYSLVLLPFFLVSDANAVLRLPSFLCAVGTLLLTWRLVRRAVSAEAAACAVAWLGLTQFFLNFAMQIRGYSLSMFLAIALGNLALREGAETTWRRGLLIATVAAFLYTLPTNVLFAVPLAVAAVGAALLRGDGVRGGLREALLWGAGAVVAVVCYVPIIDAVLGHRGSSASSEPVAQFVVRVLGLAGRDAPWMWAVWPLGLVFWIARGKAPGGRGWADRLAFPLLLLLATAGPLAALFVLRLPSLFERTMLPTLPFLAAATGWLAWEVLEGVRRHLLRAAPRWSAAAVAIALLLAIFLPRLLTHPARLAEYRDRTFAQDGYYNYYNARFCPSCVVDYLRVTVPPDEDYVVVYDPQGFFTLEHYFARLRVPQARLTRGGTATGEEAEAWVYYVVPALANWETLEERLAVPQDTLARYPLVKDFDYFRLHRSPAPVRFRRWW